MLRPGALVVTAAEQAEAVAAQLRSTGAEVVPVGGCEGGGVDLQQALAALAERDIHALLVEGGPTLAGGLVRSGTVDRYVLHVAPALLGADGLPAIAGPGAPTVTQRWQLEIEAVRERGPDLEIVARPAGDAAPSG
jgi:diaminohydroxyphosphoribosylaminopyrimidine deaminase / 5-amino-6-(5-phosphoribosylamino)uracil reductase